jgi:hypothetical protein
MNLIMKSVVLLSIFLVTSSIAFSQETIEVKKYFYKSKQVSEVYYVLKKDKSVLHGDYTKYYPLPARYLESQIDQMLSNYISEKGQYSNNKKVGIWYKYYYEGMLKFKYDYDVNDSSAISYTVSFNYPEYAKENDIQGAVKFSYEVNSSCIASNFKILQGLCEKCDVSLLNDIRKKLNTISKHVKICNPGEKVIEVNFELR